MLNLDIEDILDVPHTEKPTLPSPSEIYSNLIAHVVGQNTACKQVATLWWNHCHHRKQVAVMIGPTGSGKSEIWRTLSNYHYKHCNIHVFDASQLSANGWRGELHIRDLLLADSETYDDAEHRLIVLDEADKFLELDDYAGVNHGFDIQNNLLKLCDGDKLDFCEDSHKKETISIDTKKVSIVFCGAFESALENMRSALNADCCIGFGSNLTSAESTDYTNITTSDLMEYGNFRREILGRVNCPIIALNRMDATAFMRIMDSPTASPIVKLARQYGVNLEVDYALKEELCDAAVENQLGVRYIYAQLKILIDEQLFDNPTKSTLYLTRNQDLWEELPWN